MKTKLKIIIPIIVAVAAIIIAALTINFTSNQMSDIDSLIKDGYYYLNDVGDFDEAIAIFNKIISLDPMNVDAYIGLAQAYQGKGDIDKAIETLKTGYEKTGDQQLKNMLDELSPPEEATVTTAETTVTTVPTTVTTTETTTAIELVTVPDLAGMTQEEALSACEELGIRCDVKTEKSNTVEKGFVISQSISAGDNVPADHTISITVSEGVKTLSTDNKDKEKLAADAKYYSQIMKKFTNGTKFAAIPCYSYDYNYDKFKSLDINLLYLPETFCSFGEPSYNNEYICMQNNNIFECFVSDYYYAVELNTYGDNGNLISGSVSSDGMISGTGKMKLKFNKDGTPTVYQGQPIKIPFDISIDDNCAFVKMHSNNGSDYNVISDNIHGIQYVSGEDFNGFYKIMTWYSSDSEQLSGAYYYCWTDISEEGYTFYSGTINYGGSMYANFEKYICTKDIPTYALFDESWWDQIHDIDEVKAALNK